MLSMDVDHLLRRFTSDNDDDADCAVITSKVSYNSKSDINDEKMVATS